MSNLVSSKVKQGITKQFIKVLEDRSYPYTESAVNKIIETFLKSKDSLIKLLSKHPNWNSEKLLIQFDEDYSRQFNRTAIINFVDWLEAAIRHILQRLSLGFPVFGRAVSECRLRHKVTQLIHVQDVMIHMMIVM